MPTLPANRGRPRRLARVIATSIALGYLLTGCGSTVPESEQPGKTVQVEGVDGKVSIPVTDTNVWALDPIAATELLVLGVTPTHVGRYGEEGDAAHQAREQALTDAGARLVEPENIELILKTEPDLIVGTQSPATDGDLADLEKIAPVLISDSAAPWDESLAALGRVTGHASEARAVIEHIDARVADTRRRIEAIGHGGETVSLISACGTGNVCVYDSGGTAGAVLTELGFKRPSDQRSVETEYNFTTVSTEKLGSLVAPINIILAGSVQHGAKSPLKHPLYDVSDAIAGEVDFAAWFGVGSLDVPWILNDIHSLLLEDGTIADRNDGLRFIEELRDVAA